MNAHEISVKGQLAGKRVLITGTTGFLGKVVLEKLIREIPEIGTITLLIRENNLYPTARERFDQEIADASIFGRLREEDPLRFKQFCLDKIDCIAGEVTEKAFGLPPEQFIQLASRIDVVIHSAACVNFREELGKALSINTLSLLNIKDLVKAAGNIPLIHVSTCYVNGFNKGDCFEEIVNPAGKSIRRNPAGYYEVKPVIAAIQQKIAAIEKACIDPVKRSDSLVELGVNESHRYGWNDSYTFTKWMGEQLIMEELQGSALTIVRPSVIESTLEEPVPGWIEGVKVADAITLAYARQKTTFFPVREKGIIDIIPADLVANSLIMAAAEVIALPGKQRIYQCCSGSVNPVTVGRMIHIQQTEMNRNYARYDRLLPKGKPRREFRPMHQGLFVLAMAVLKTVVLSYAGICKFMGVRNRFRSLTDFVNTTMKLAVTFSFYGAPNCRYHNAKLMDLAFRVTPADRQHFSVDAQKIDWEQYIGPMHLAGLNRYALKDRSRKPIAARLEKTSLAKGNVTFEAA